ncbi:MAG: PEP-CTERM sorting domain-containing protein [Phenylobacterium sp.]|uniref:PEPxxWA-CTERM sorting domain-containing protein n=1 Tax=Phenylobacterium sp. TaxID=1871053 RepID=UPI0025F5C8CD|nr:PEPxxWA-CTERM sorting domain-containing protein [Phenylobacterium sp.]MBI1196568.1 PEP-CTERM sorting domain-containing protein [Phenylobacterium sp.]
MRRTILKLAAAAALAGLPMAAQAAVTYSFVADSSENFVDGSTTFTGSFEVTLADYVTSNTVVPLASLTSCSVVASNGGATSCLNQGFTFPSPDYNWVDFGLNYEGGENHFYYYFELGAFATNGVHESIVLGPEQHGFLTVSGSPDTGGPGTGGPGTGGVPEPATWALLIAGFGMVGGAMRRRARAAFA